MKTWRCLKCLTFTQQPAQRFPFSLHTFQYLLLSNVAVLKYCSHLMIRSMAAPPYGSQCKSGIRLLPPQTHEIRGFVARSRYGCLCSYTTGWYKGQNKLSIYKQLGRIGGVKVCLHALTSAIDGEVKSTSRSCRPDMHSAGGLVGSTDGLTFRRTDNLKLLHAPGFEPQTVQYAA